MYHTDKHFARFSCKSFLNRYLLISFWFVGLLFGLYFTSDTSVSSVSLMRSVTQDRLSFIGLFLMFTFPFFISAALFRLSKPLLILPIIFFKAFTYSCCLYSVMFAYGEAGWLVRWLLLFSESCIIVLFIWYCIRNISGGVAAVKADLVLCCVLSVVIICIDYYIVSPLSVVLY